MSLADYIDDLEVDDRPVAREWGAMDSDEFQARMGPEVSHIMRIIEVRPRWYNLRLSEIARIAAAGIIAAIGRGAV